MAPGTKRQHTRAMRSAPTRLALALAVYSTVVILASIAIEVQTHIRTGPSPHWAAFIEIPLALTFGPIAVMIVSRQPRNPIPWLLLFFSCTAGTSLIVGYIAQEMLAHGTSGANWVAWVSSWMISPAFASLYVLLLQLFPTGRPPSPRFRPLLRASIAIIIVATLIQPITGDKLDPYTSVSNPVGLLPAWVNGVLVICEACILCLSIVSLVARFRRASGLERLQLGWYVLGAMLTALLFVTALVVYAFSAYIGDGLFAISGGMVIALPALGGIAMIRHRLYDVDVVLNRALVYGALSACVVGAYAGLVFGVGTIASGQGTVVAAAAAALCALAAAPLRSRLQRGVNRLLYGARDEPVAAVDRPRPSPRGDARAGRRPADARSSRWRARCDCPTRRSSSRRPTASWREPRWASRADCRSRSCCSPRASRSATPAALAAARGRGAVAAPTGSCSTISPGRPGRPSRPSGCTADLQRSRERLVTAREEERRRLRRDLHDGLGAHARRRSRCRSRPRGSLDRASPRHAELLAALEQRDRCRRIADIRRLVYDLRPPALDELGLVRRLRELAPALRRACA